MIALYWIHLDVLLFARCILISPQGGIQVTENGCAIEPKSPIHGAPGATADADVDDTGRIAYFQGYLEEMHNAIQLGADVRAVRCSPCTPAASQLLTWRPLLLRFLTPHTLPVQWTGVSVKT